MSIIYAFVLHIFHFVYAILLRYNTLKKRYFTAPPQPLTAPRRRIPKHLAIVFALEPSLSEDLARDALTESVLNAVEWCRTVGIKKLTVYEENDALSKCTQTLCERLPVEEHDVDSGESDTDYPLTPPPSDHSQSRPLSPSDIPRSYTPMTTLRISEKLPHNTTQKEKSKLSRRRQHSQKSTECPPKHDLLLCMISSEASKPAIAAVAQALAERERRRLDLNSSSSPNPQYKLSVQDLDQILEDDAGLSSPDFMIIHPLDISYSSPAPPELHGFPPWHIRLTEIFQNHPRDSCAQPLFNWRRSSLPIPLDELGFREALDEYAAAEMRFGK